MNKKTRVAGLFGLLFSLLSCTSSEVNVSNNFKAIVYYSPTHINGARTVIPMTEKRIRRKKTKNIVSQQLYKSIDSIINSSCSGGTPDDNMMILIQINTGEIAIHQNGKISVKNKVCNNVTVEEAVKLIKLTNLKARIIK